MESHLKGQKRVMNSLLSPSTNYTTTTKRRKSDPREAHPANISTINTTAAVESIPSWSLSKTYDLRELWGPQSWSVPSHHESASTTSSTNQSTVQLDLAVSEFRTSLRGIRTAMAFGMNAHREWNNPLTLEAACLAMLNAILTDHRCCIICQSLPSKGTPSACFVIDGNIMSSLENHCGLGTVWLLHKVLTMMNSHIQLLTMKRTKDAFKAPQQQEASAVIRSLLQLTMPFVHRRICDRAKVIQETITCSSTRNQHAANLRIILSRWNIFWATQHLLLGENPEAEQQFRLAFERDGSSEGVTKSPPFMSTLATAKARAQCFQPVVVDEEEPMMMQRSDSLNDSSMTFEDDQLVWPIPLRRNNLSFGAEKENTRPFQSLMKLVAQPKADDVTLRPQSFHPFHQVQLQSED